jgi:hypothetical protein
VGLSFLTIAMFHVEKTDKFNSSASFGQIHCKFLFLLKIHYFEKRIGHKIYRKLVCR